MKTITKIGIAVIVLGVGYAGFWTLANREGKGINSSYRQGVHTREQFAAHYPFLSMAFRCLGYDPFDPAERPTRIEDSPQARVERQVWCGACLISLGGALASAGLRNGLALLVHYLCVAFSGGAFFMFMARHLMTRSW